MLRGLTTITYFADDLRAARTWYTELLGADAYFVRDVGDDLAYLEFRIGDYEHELGIINRRFAPHMAAVQPAGAVAYWAVDDVHASFDRLLALGATTVEEPFERGPGFVTASVLDPFGNLLGIMFNQHYFDMLA